MNMRNERRDIPIDDGEIKWKMRLLAYRCS